MANSKQLGLSGNKTHNNLADSESSERTRPSSQKGSLPSKKRKADDTSTTSDRPAKKNRTTNGSSSCPSHIATTETTSLSEPHTFHQFTRLPVEVRRMIWMECLPRRVIEVDSVSCFDVNEGDRTSQANRRPPVISQVNFEAREVVFENLTTRSRVHFGGSALQIPWLQPSRDTMHVHWPHWPAIGRTSQRVEDGMVRRMFWWHHDIGFTQPMSIPAELLALFGHNDRDKAHAGISHLFAGHWGAFCREQREFDVVLSRLTLHAPHTKARKSGLFGLLGDEPVQLVDVHDRLLLSRFHRLSREGPGTRHPSQDMEAYSFLHNKHAKKNTMTYKLGLYHWQVRAVCSWIKQRWYYAMDDEEERGPHLPERQDLWAKNKEGRRVPNIDVPWVRVQLAAMPELKPKYMIRLCYEKCCREL